MNDTIVTGHWNAKAEYAAGTSPALMSKSETGGFQYEKIGIHWPSEGSVC